MCTSLFLTLAVVRGASYSCNGTLYADTQSIQHNYLDAALAAAAPLL
jgi:hypothetical protein